MSVFDKEVEVFELPCAQCQRTTRHQRTDKKALFTCVDPKHVHPTREDQENNRHPGV